MSAYEIPFLSQPQTFTIDLAGTTYRLATSWNMHSQCWVLDIATPDGEQVVAGIPIVTGTDLLKQYAYLGVKGRLFVQSAGDVTKVPGFADLGASGLVFFVTD